MLKNHSLFSIIILNTTELQFTFIMICCTGMNKTLDEVTYQDRFAQDLILQSFQEIEFVGVKGFTKFGSSGKASAIIQFLQQQGIVHLSKNSWKQFSILTKCMTDT